MQHLALLGFVVISVFAGYVLYHTKVNIRDSLSIHISHYRKSIRFGMLLIPLVGILFGAWYFLWYAANREVPLWMSLAVVLFSAGVAVTGLVPYGQSKTKDTLHDVAIWSGGILLPIFLVGLIYTTPGVIAKSVVAVCLFALVVAYSLARLSMRAKQYFLVVQLAGLFFLAVAVAFATYS